MQMYKCEIPNRRSLPRGRSRKGGLGPRGGAQGLLFHRATRQSPTETEARSGRWTEPSRRRALREGSGSGPAGALGTWLGRLGQKERQETAKDAW